MLNLFSKKFGTKISKKYWAKILKKKFQKVKYLLQKFCPCKRIDLNYIFKNGGIEPFYTKVKNSKHPLFTKLQLRSFRLQGQNSKPKILTRENMIECWISTELMASSIKVMSEMSSGRNPELKVFFSLVRIYKDG